MYSASEGGPGGGMLELGLAVEHLVVTARAGVDTCLKVIFIDLAAKSAECHFLYRRLS